MGLAGGRPFKNGVRSELTVSPREACATLLSQDMLLRVCISRIALFSVDVDLVVILDGNTRYGTVVWYTTEWC